MTASLLNPDDGLRLAPTYVARVPSPVEALTLMADKRFRDAIVSTVAVLEEWRVPTDVMARYLRLRYLQGQPVAAIVSALRTTPYRLRIVAASAHFFVWLSLSQTAPELAQVLGYIESDTEVQHD